MSQEVNAEIKDSIELYERIENLNISKDTKVIYQGVEGAFSEQATIAFFGEEITRSHVDSFEDILVALEKGEADFGVLPIENSTAGYVSGSYDLLLNHDVCIVAEEIIKVEQALLGVKGATIEDIDTVYSHIQGLLQSKEFLSQHGWSQIAYDNTAMAAKKIKEDNKKSQAAIASKRAAMLYDLDILNPCINSASTNYTRFVILTKKRQYLKDANRISISFSLPHKAGALYNVLGHFIYHHLNMTSIESSPRRDTPWEYNFFISFDGNLSQDEVRSAMEGIYKETLSFRILGNY